MKDYNLDEMLKQVKKDTVDEEFHKFYTKTLNSLPNKKRKLNKSIIAAASVFLIAMLSFSPIVSGGDIPILKTIKNIFFAPEEYVKYAEGIDTKVELRNFRVSLHDIIYDNNFLIYSYTLSKLDGKPFTQDEEMAGVSLHPVFKTTENFSGSEFNRVKNSPSEITIIRYDNISKLNLPNKLKFSMLVYNFIEDIDTNIDIEIEKSEINKYCKKVIIDKNIKIDNGKLCIDSISFSPFGAVFTGKNIGQWYLHNDSPYRVAILDDNGKEIFINSSSASYNYNDNIVEFCKELELNQYKDSKTITIKVYDTRDGKELDDSSVTISVPKYNKF
ncbi:DUF4179 domain-containing protein [Clostridium cochlearium]|uniref:DUF4179 domain-containing protein n=1 Tax=Clostridium cochlearium TaxID=1494 RepID=UPI0014591FE5|nr:DUF4179 domain-containing protein [Clostridium cochlearium]